VPGGDAEQGSEGGVPGAPAVEAEDEFIEVGLEVLAALPLVGAQGPDPRLRGSRGQACMGLWLSRATSVPTITAW